jgi:ferrochelatase
MKAILLANMGAPDSEKEMKTFLKRMFCDKAIINAPALVRFIVSLLISNFRYKSSWKKYLQVGGSPLQKSMNTIKSDLEQYLPAKYMVSCVYSYSQPFLKDEIIKLHHSGIKDFLIISMYPQSSFSTTGSVEMDIDKIKTLHEDIKIRFIEDYYDNAHFITFWTKLITDKITEKSYSKPYLLFSAHAIPQSFIERGDVYVEKINATAKIISDKMKVPYSVSYQSKIGKIQWTKPYTADHLGELMQQGINQIIIVPISFINENLETKFDLDTELLPFAQNELKINDICRIEIPESNESLVKMFYEFILPTHENN